MERKKGLTHVSTVDEQVRRGARCFSSKPGRWPRAWWYDETVTQHDTFLYPQTEDIFFLSSFWPPQTGTTAPPPFFLLMNVQKVTVKKGLVCLYFFLFPHSGVSICQGASVRCRGPKRLGSSFVLYAHREKGTKMEHQAKGVILQQEKDLTCRFVHISAWL